MIAVTGITQWYNGVNVTEDEPMDAKNPTPVNEVIELTALVDMKVGDIVVYDLDALTVTHATDWNYMGVVLTDCKAGEKVEVFRHGKITITASTPSNRVYAHVISPAKEFADEDALKDALQTDYDYFDHDVFDE